MGIRDKNLSSVLKMIRTLSPVSRTDLSRATGLTKTTITETIDILTRAGLITVTGEGGASSRGGRKPILLSFRDGALKAVGVDIRREKIVGLLLDQNGTVLDSTAELLSSRASKAQVLDTLRRMISRYLEGDSAQPNVIGIGVGVPGPMDWKTGTIFRPLSFDSLHDVSVKDIIGSWYDVPVRVETGAVCGAISEYFHQSSMGRDIDELIFMEIDFGLGFALVNRGSVVHGLSSAGEVGHIVVDPTGPECTCGRRGCLDLYSSGAALLKAVNQGSQLKVRRNSSYGKEIERISELWKRDPEAISPVLERIGSCLSQTIVNIFNLVSPNLFVLGSSLVDVAEMYLAALQPYLSVESGMERDIAKRIVLASYGANAIAAGAATLVFHDFFESPTQFMGYVHAPSVTQGV